MLEPHDTVTVRDGRPFDAGQQHMARATTPSPTTIAGAVGQALGANPAEVHGPLVVRRRQRHPRPGRPGRTPAASRPPVWEALFPVPADVVRPKGDPSWSLLVPPDPVGRPGTGDPGDAGGSGGTGGSGDAGGSSRTKPAATVSSDLPADVGLLSGDGEPVGGWWTSNTLEKYLHDRDKLADYLGTSAETVSEDAPWKPERHVGLARTLGRVASDGMLYSAEHLRPLDGVGFAARCIGLPAAPNRPRTVRFGGEGRRAQLHELAGAVPALPALPAMPALPALPALPADPAEPDEPDGFPGGRVLLYLATPALFADGWRPAPASLPPGVRLVAAAVPGPQVVSTARPDHATGAVGNTRLWWAVPAGSIYYLHVGPPADPRAIARACHDKLLTHTSPFPQIDDDVVTAGFGLAFTGRW